MAYYEDRRGQQAKKTEKTNEIVTWLKMRASEIVKLKIVKPLARSWKGRISTV